MSSHFLRRRLAAAVIGLVVLATGCGSDSAESSSTTAPATSSTAASAELCSTREALKTSILALKDIDIVKNGTSAVEAALATIRTNLTRVKAAASADLQPPISTFEDALTALQTAVTNLGSGGVAPVVNAATAVGTTGSALVTSLEAARCN